MFLTGRTTLFEVPRKLHFKAMATQTSNGVLTGNQQCRNAKLSVETALLAAYNSVAQNKAGWMT